MSRFPAQVSHWSSAVGAQLQLLRSRKGLTRLAAGRLLTQLQEQAADGYLSELRQMARDETDLLKEYGEQLSAAEKLSASCHQRYQGLVLVLAEASKLGRVREKVASLAPGPGELKELDDYIGHLESAQEDADKAAVDAVLAVEATEAWAWRVERIRVRLRVIERETTTLLAAASLGDHLPKE